MPLTNTRRRTALALSLTIAPAAAGTALAYDLNDTLEINLLAAVGGQCQQVSGDTDAEDVCRGATPISPEVVYKPTKNDRFFLKLGFSAGSALDNVSPFTLSAWDADLESTVKHINGGNRSFLLEAWYAHTFRFSDSNKLQITGGILDPEYYVNENAYANDPYTQFMNEAFVAAHTAFVPDYDWGGALVWTLGNWAFSGVGMNVAENDYGRNYNWYAAQVAYTLKTSVGEGHYRLMYIGTSSAFPAWVAPADHATDPDGNADEAAVAPPDDKRLGGWAISFDQAFGKVVGVFLRLASQDDETPIQYKNEYSGGLDFKGSGWGREADNIGLGVARLAGGNGVLDRTDLFEGYYRFAVNKYLALTADVQYMQDRYDDGSEVSGWLWGLRAVTEF